MFGIGVNGVEGESFGIEQLLIFHHYCKWRWKLGRYNPHYHINCMRNVTAAGHQNVAQCLLNCLVFGVDNVAG